MKGVQETVSSLEKPMRVLDVGKLGDPVRKRSESIDLKTDGEKDMFGSGKSNCYMTITGSIKDDGLGKAEWWEAGEEEEGGEEEEV